MKEVVIVGCGTNSYKELRQQIVLIGLDHSYTCRKLAEYAIRSPVVTNATRSSILGGKKRRNKQNLFGHFAGGR